jgi:coproporphyrinogen III oxidase-like Fe-S oxidoreductase
MGLRLKEGINEKSFFDKVGSSISDNVNKNKLNFLIEHKFLELKEGHLFASSEGKLVLNHIIEQLIDIK